MKDLSVRDRCPTESELSRFAVGALPGSRIDSIALHLEGCRPCERRLAGVEPLYDAVLDGVRGASAAGGGDPCPVPEELLVRARSLARHAPAEHPAGGPRRLGKFELLEELGSGTFGSVYRARDGELDRTVAIKVLRAGSLAGPEQVDRFLREARSAAQLKHPGVVLLYGTGRTETGIFYLVEEYVQGGTLAERLKNERPGSRRAAELVEAIALALDYAHREGVIHRDLKPSNIVLDQEGRPHLMDFGLAKRDAEDAPATPDGQVLGTPAYMSPEQAVGDSNLVDARSDLYSLGVVLYEVLTGRRPFEGTREQQLLQVLQGSPRAPRRHDPRIPRDLETICLKAMARDPRQRYQAGQALAADLRRFLDGEPICARRAGPLERLWRWSRRNPLAVGLLLAMTFGSVGGFWYISRVSGELIRRSALEGAAMQADMLEKVNAHYTSNVVGRLPKETATHDYRLRTGSVPLPATFLTELGREISAGRCGMEVRHYSDHPFFSRRDGGPPDDFARDAIRFFRERQERGEPFDQPYYRFVDDFGGQPALRYATPRIMQKDCVVCHNERAESTKRDWKVGDVGGVLEIIRHVGGDGALSLRGIFFLVASISGSLLALCVLSVVVERRRRFRVTVPR